MELQKGLGCSGVGVRDFILRVQDLQNPADPKPYKP